MKNKFLNSSKYILQEIFSYLEEKKKLTIIKYCKKLMEKIDITKFIYQKAYFNSIVSQTILDNPFILEKQNIFDKKTLDKLISEWEEETEEASDISEKESLNLAFGLYGNDEEDKKKKFFEDLDKIFQCKFVEENIYNEVEKEEDEFRKKKRYWYEVYKNHSIFKDPIKVFQKKNIGNLNFFHLSIVIYVDWDITSCPVCVYCYDYDYLFHKTKGNKYLFKTEFEEKLIDIDYAYEWRESSIRYCKTKRFEDYYFINNKIKLDYFTSEDQLDELYFKEFNTFKFFDRYHQQYFNSFFQKDFLGNKLEKIHLGYVNKESNIIENINKCPKLKCFIIDDFDQIDSLIELLRTLFSLKSLFLIDISFKGRLELDENEQKEINELFPCLSIVITEKKSSLIWKYGTKRFKKILKLKKIKNKK